jgi:hypothetical protein
MGLLSSSFQIIGDYYHKKKTNEVPSFALQSGLKIQTNPEQRSGVGRTQRRSGLAVCPIKTMTQGHY